MDVKKAVILAGGFGTRLRKVVPNRPKPMALIAGKPFLDHQIRYLRDQGVGEIVLAVHYMADNIKSYFMDGRRLGVNITYSEEDTPLGTGGAIKNAQKYLGGTFFVLNGDSYSKLDFKNFLDFHKTKNSGFTTTLIESDNSSRSGKVILDETGKVLDFSYKSDSGKSLISTGVYVVEPRILDLIEPGKNVSLEEIVLPELVKRGEVHGYLSKDYFIDIGVPETYNKFRRDILESMFLDGNREVIEAMQKIRSSGVDLVLVNDRNSKLMGIVNNGIISEYLIKGGRLTTSLDEMMIRNPVTALDSDEESRIISLLDSGINRLPVLNKEGKVIDVRFKVDETKNEIFPIFRGKSPLRISFAGGGTDLPYFFERYGGVVINSTIDKFCYATAIKRADSKILINSDNGEILVDSKKMNYDGNFDLIKAIVKIMKPDFGLELYLHNDLPFGKGLGSSASSSVLVAKLISELEGSRYNDEELAKIAFMAETEELGIKGGWQDQYAAVTGGFSFMEFSKEKNIIYPLRIKEDIINELNSRLLLCSVGQSHHSGDKHQKQERVFRENESDLVKNLESMKEDAMEIRDSLLSGNIDNIGHLLHESWEKKKNLSPDVSNERIDRLYTAGLNNGAYGGKLLGAGGGGYLLFFYSPKRRSDLAKALRNEGGEIMDFNFENRGVQTWAIKD